MSADQMAAESSPLSAAIALAALDSMAHGVCVWDREFRLAFFNKAYVRMYRIPDGGLKVGMSLVNVIGAGIATTLPGASPEDLAEDYRKRVLAGGTREEVIIERLKGDGRTFRMTSTPIADGAWVVLHEDVTETKSYIDALREREEEIVLQNARFDFAVSNMRQGLCMFDRDKKLVFWNNQYADMYGIPRDRIKRGDTLQRILQLREEAGNHAIGGNEAFVNNRLAVAGDDEPAAFVVKLEGGRAISILHQPLKDGGWVATHFDITEERRSEERIHHLARHDALTGLPNRVLFHEHVESLEERVAHGDTMAVLCVDLDHFKAANDTLGHAIGDAVLKEVAQRLVACTREGDVVARLGGDEFTVIHGPLRCAEDAALLADRIVKSVAEPFHVQGNHIAIGASVGIAVAPRDGRDGESLQKAADLACYRAKREGRGGFDFFEKGMDAPAREKRHLAVWLRSALAKNQLFIEYQPIVDLRTNAVSGVEALLRWRHPQRGLVPPAEFILVAEETGAIVPIGEWVLRQACRDAAAWPARIKVAVNLSPVQFKRRNNFTETVVSALADSGLPPERLELEITESVMLTKSEDILRTLHQLRRLGIRVCMDDFGTGYSSLSYLRAFPFDKIKIDRSFLKDSGVRSEGVAIIRAIVGLGKGLGMTLTAEGVETPDQLALVKRQGCTEAQGFLLGRPAPAAAVEMLFDRTQLHVGGSPREKPQTGAVA
jgi:diguanylate cyclase (GGDEF)-like protein